MNTLGVYLHGNADLASSCQWVPTNVDPGATPLPIYPTAIDLLFAELDDAIARIKQMIAECPPAHDGAERRDDAETCLARANGWGSAGQCLALGSAKTPAVRARVCRDAAAARNGGDHAPCASAPRTREAIV